MQQHMQMVTWPWPHIPWAREHACPPALAVGLQVLGLLGPGVRGAVAVGMVIVDP